jgi:hypothetical protein
MNPNDGAAIRAIVVEWRDQTERADLAKAAGVVLSS